MSQNGFSKHIFDVILLQILGPESDHFADDAKLMKMANGVKKIPEGVVVAMICNIDSVGMTQLALEIAKNFENVKFESPYRVQKVYLCWKELQLEPEIRTPWNWKKSKSLNFSYQWLYDCIIAWDQTLIFT